jgi:gliding motility-associated-like protein
MLNVYRTLIVFALFAFTLQAQTVPVFTIASTYSFACTDHSANFTATSDPSLALTYTWSMAPAKNAALSATTGSAISAVFAKDLTYTITVQASDGATVTTLTKKITAYKSARASFNANIDATGYPAQLQLTNYSTGSIYSVWQFSDQQKLDSVYNTSKYYNTSGSYSVTLFAYGQKSCNDTSTYAFRISDSSSVVLPTIFTPNGDNANDVFKPISTGISALSTWIYNREGMLVYNWNKINGFWDGHTTSGELCQDGVYFVILEATGFDGKSYKLKGNLTLLR